MINLFSFVSEYKNGIGDNYKSDFLFLVSEISGFSKHELLFNKELCLKENDFAILKSSINLLISGKPLEYILGCIDFCGLKIPLMDGCVLIPRPETEELVGICCDYIRKHPRCIDILDLCCGSGCIAASVKHKCHCVNMFASDVSIGAVDSCKHAFNQLGLSIHTREGSWFDCWNGMCFDMIISNPPYISEVDWQSLDSSVKDFEPVQALIGGEKGTEAFEFIHSKASGFLNSGGCLFLEIGHDQADYLIDLFCGNVWTDTIILSDMFGKRRFLFSRVNF